MRRKPAPQMPAIERLALAVLLFHSKGAWVEEKSNEWLRLTDTREATTKTLCDLARRLLKETQPATPSRPLPDDWGALRNLGREP